ncbi:MAG: 50S ribosomal protein L35 [Candidatus Berkelbacteria bacterium]
MPKLKTHKSTAKRFKITGSGKIMHVRAAANHLLTHKSNRLRGLVEISKNDQSRVKKLLNR